MIKMDGKAVSLSVKERIKKEIAENKYTPGLAVIIAGDDPASKTYVKNKKKACEFCGIRSFEYALPADVSEQELLELIAELNKREDVDGILCQLPLPAHIHEKAVIEAIDSEKDVDAFSEVNTGRIMIGNHYFLPCTPAGVMELLRYYNIDTAGKNAVVIGRSNIVGKPMAMLLMHSDATVTVCHSKTKNLAEICSRADIIVAAIGREKFVTADMVKEGAVVIDVGINRGADGKLHGDVDFEAVSRKASYITPVPGGVGPMTIAMLMQNTLTSYKNKINKD